MTLRGAVGGVLIVWSLALPLVAEQAARGAEAFERKDFAAAAEAWRDEAGAGSAAAKFGLGLLSDLGLGVPRDAAKALRWYFEAATAGYVDAQFNVGVMLDAGTGGPRDVRAAAAWYGRAAANGHRRAQYNLGLLYSSGEGVPQNADLARYWLGVAAEALPAAAERLAKAAPANSDRRSLTAPAALVGAVVADATARRAEMVWSAPPGPQGARFLLEVARLPAAGETSGAVFISITTEASAGLVRLPWDAADYAWRVSLVDAAAARYAASPWQWLSGAALEAGSVPFAEGRVTMRVAEGDARAGRLARELADSFVAAGLWVQIEPALGPADESSVAYGFRDDVGLAGAISEFLPVLTAEDATLASYLGPAPGEIVVRLVGGPDG